MKKVLLATTALVAFAGAATADVELSGGARFGVQWNDGASPSADLEKRVTINIDASTETDSGLEMGARVRLRNNETEMSSVNGAVVYAKMGGFKLSVGNVCGAIECMPGMYAGTVGLNGNSYHNVVANNLWSGYWNWVAYSSSGPGFNGAEIEYSVGDFSAMLSTAMLNDSPLNNNVVSAHVAYTFGDWTVAAAVQDDGGTGVFDQAILTVGGKIGDFGVGLAYADNDGNAKVTLNGSLAMGATTVSLFVSDEDLATDTAWGLGAAYDLGGASLVAGYSSSPLGFASASAGVKFKF